MVYGHRHWAALKGKTNEEFCVLYHQIISKQSRNCFRAKKIKE